MIFDTTLREWLMFFAGMGVYILLSYLLKNVNTKTDI